LYRDNIASLWFLAQPAELIAQAVKSCLCVGRCVNQGGTNHNCKQPDRFLKCMTPVYDEVGRRSIYQNVKIFIRSKTNIWNVAIFKYSWHRFGKTILRRKYQLI